MSHSKIDGPAMAANEWRDSTDAFLKRKCYGGCVQGNLLLRICNDSGVCSNCVLSHRLLGAVLCYVSVCRSSLLTPFHIGYFDILSFIHSPCLQLHSVRLVSWCVFLLIFIAVTISNRICCYSLIVIFLMFELTIYLSGLKCTHCWQRKMLHGVSGLTCKHCCKIDMLQA